MSQPKIALIGGGNIGATIAHLILQRNIGHVTILDIAEGIPQGKSLDLLQSCAVDNVGGTCTGTNDPKDIDNADVVIVTAGIARKPGMTRDDLLGINGQVMTDVGGYIKKYCPQAFVIVVTNPLDVMVWLLQKVSGLPTQKVVGMAGVLDSSRFKCFLAEALKVSTQDIQTFVLGGHGDSMVPLPRYTTISGIPLLEFVRQGLISESELTAIVDRTRNGGAEIVNLLKAGSAYYAPASSALAMAESYLYDQRRILPCATYLNGPYGVQGVYAGVPVIIGKNGVEKVVELTLNNEETQQFNASVEAVKGLMSAAQKLGL